MRGIGKLAQLVDCFTLQFDIVQVMWSSTVYYTRACLSLIRPRLYNLRFIQPRDLFPTFPEGYLLGTVCATHMETGFISLDGLKLRYFLVLLAAQLSCGVGPISIVLRGLPALRFNNAAM